MNTVTSPRFTLADADRAHSEWGANCGPGAIAAILNMTLDELRPVMAANGFEGKYYTNPTMMLAVLRDLRAVWSKAKGAWPSYGLVRVQWEGPWTKPGVPMRARYRYTHWIGAAQRNGEVGVFDINCMNNGTGWCSLENWRDIVVPALVEQYPKASGGWHLTHALEVEKHARVTRTALSFPGDADLELSQ